MREQIPSPEYPAKDMRKRAVAAAVEMNRESNGSSAEEMDESPRSVAKVVENNNVNVYMHSQILRIIAEDSLIGEDIGEGVLSVKEGFSGHHFAQIMVFSRPVSPLGAETAQ